MSVFHYSSKLLTVTAVIENGQSLSNTVDLGGTSLLAVLMPASWTAADITLQASVDGTNFFNIYAAGGTEMTLSAAAGRCIRIDPLETVAFRYLRLRSGTSSVAVNQGADRAITLISRAI